MNRAMLREENGGLRGGEGIGASSGAREPG